MSAFYDADGTYLCEFCGDRLQASETTVVDGIIRNVAVPAQPYKTATQARDERQRRQKKRVRGIIAKMRGEKTRLE
jgi:ribosome-binding protein aMBF1 (putative translation factor)